MGTNIWNPPGGAWNPPGAVWNPVGAPSAANPSLPVTHLEVTYNPNFPVTFVMATVSGKETAIRIGSGQIEVANPLPVYRDPEIILRWSDDGGKTWSQGRTLKFGQAGDYLKRAITRRLGRSRDRRYRITCSDPVPIRLIEAYLRATDSQGRELFPATERISHQLRKGA